MRPKPVPVPADGGADLFRTRLENMIDMRHELVRLALLIDWRCFEDAFGPLYAEDGRPGLATRLMVGLHILKHARDLSDEHVCAAWLENAYFQFPRLRGDKLLRRDLFPDQATVRPHVHVELAQTHWRGEA